MHHAGQPGSLLFVVCDFDNEDSELSCRAFADRVDYYRRSPRDVTLVIVLSCKEGSADVVTGSAKALALGKLCDEHDLPLLIVEPTTAGLDGCREWLIEVARELRALTPASEQGFRMKQNLSEEIIAAPIFDVEEQRRCIVG